MISFFWKQEPPVCLKMFSVTVILCTTWCSQTSWKFPCHNTFQLVMAKQSVLRHLQLKGYRRFRLKGSSCKTHSISVIPGRGQSKFICGPVVDDGPQVETPWLKCFQTNRPLSRIIRHTHKQNINIVSKNRYMFNAHFLNRYHFSFWLNVFEFTWKA